MRTGTRRASGGPARHARRAAAVARVREGAGHGVVAARYGISTRTLSRWLAAST
ncbi:helix-turn-helix domain-containing protein [Pseudonocardia sp. NPDC049635]|uniref:helix-turn-helix domain-containing protein n=1 Tax=Pseudonocardia sp. NPDC049635 TaxID=3155506 RepID=UPI0033D5A635